MNQFDNSSVSPVYMSQVEANEVMELWAQRQREEAERQGMVTVHDVAEATQLSPQEVQQLLQTIRMSRTSQVRTAPTTIEQSDEIPLGPAVVRVLPYTGFVALPLAMILRTINPWENRVIANALILWTFAMLVYVVAKYVRRLAREAEAGRSLRALRHKIR